jgi:hypothetical protein
VEGHKSAYSPSPPPYPPYPPYPPPPGRVKTHRVLAFLYYLLSISIFYRFAYVPAAEHAVCTQLTAPPTLARLILGLPPGWYALWQS